MKKKIILISSTMVEGTFRKMGWEGEVSKRTARSLKSMGKCTYEDDEKTEVNLAIDVTNTEVFEELKNENKNLKIEIAQVSEIVSTREDEYRNIYTDLMNISTLKELKEIQKRYR